MKSYILLFTLLFPLMSFAQDDLLDLLNEMEEETTEYAFATFKSVRIINAHSVEMAAPGVMQLIISHRFGRLNSGPYEFFGLDQANMRLGFEYGFAKWLNVGVGRSNVNKTYDGFVKVRFLRQSKGKKKMPITVVGLSSMQVNSLRWADPTRINYFTSRLSFAHQIMIARKFGDRLSLQLMPTMVHRNLVETRAEENDVYAIGGGGRFKITPSISINAEYFYLLPGHTRRNFENSLSFSFDIETGGHVFQLMFTNSLGMTENLFIPQTTGDWRNGDIHFGFNLARVFTVDRKRNSPPEKKDW